MGHEQIERVRRAFRRRFGKSPEMLVRAPGRVALLGAHVDYSEGWVLPAAIERAVYLAASPRVGAETTLLALDEQAEARLAMDALPPPLRERQAPLEWPDLPAGIAWALAERGLRAPALDVVYGGDLPAGAGVSSSAAVAVAFSLAWRRAAGLELGDLDVARLCQRMENDYLGVQSGIMDPFASLFGRSEQAILLDCRTLGHELVPMPRSAAVVVFDSGVRRRLAQSGFNDRRDECRQAVAVFGRHLDGVATLRDVSERDFELHSHHLPPTLRQRARHAIGEMRRVRDGADALRRGDLDAFGALMRRSHLSSRDFYDVSIAELDLLAASCWPLAGCWGARMMGGGFGGCVAALVEASRAADIAQRVGDAFEERYGRRPPAFTSSLAGGAGFETVLGGA